MYQCQYFTINNSISDCDHKYETRHAEPEIGTDGSSQTRRNPRVDGYGSGFGPQESGSQVFGRLWNQTDPFLWSKPGPLAGYPDPLLSLAQLDVSGFSLCHCVGSGWLSQVLRKETAYLTSSGWHVGNRCLWDAKFDRNVSRNLCSFLYPPHYCKGSNILEILN